MKALVDADTPIYSTALVSEDVSEGIAKSRLDVNISKLLDNTRCSEYVLFVSGGDNFRKEIDPSYKGNRTQPDPIHREALRQHLITQWGAVECDGYEADDACGIYQKPNGETVIVAIDKDLLQVPGIHYSWPIIKKGVVVRDHRWLEISEEEGMRRFFTQMLTGDVSDNIVGVEGIGKVRSEKVLAPCHTEEAMYETVLNLYGEDTERFYKNLDMLWIWRNFGETYSIRKEIYGIK